jgi:uncharacterized protein (TIGR02996 family)
MTANDLERDLDAIREQLRCDLANDTLRMVYADCLEDNGYDSFASEQRAIARMQLNLRAFVTDVDGVKNAYLSWLGEPNGVCEDDVIVEQRIHEDLLVPTFRLYLSVDADPNNWYEADGWYVTCESRGDLTVKELEREIQQS